MTRDELEKMDDEALINLFNEYASNEHPEDCVIHSMNEIDNYFKKNCISKKDLRDPEIISKKFDFTDNYFASEMGDATWIYSFSDLEKAETWSGYSLKDSMINYILEWEE